MKDLFFNIFRKEIIPSFGCTEPIAIALAASKAASLLPQKDFKHIRVECSGNIIKNVKSVVIPNSNGHKGIEWAAVLGALVANPDNGLRVLEGVTEEMKLEAEKFVAAGKCSVQLVEGVSNLFIKVVIATVQDEVAVTVALAHNNIVDIILNGESIFHKDYELKDSAPYEITFDDIYNFVKNEDISEVYDILAKQIEFNKTISDEGLKNAWGSNIGKLLMSTSFDDFARKVRAHAAAGSDARMSGCSMPVMINSGSGNQGLTVSMPLIVYAGEHEVSSEELYKALFFANMIGLYLKQKIGKLSAYCGVSTAAAAGVAGLAFIKNETKEIIEAILINALATISGMICDGAKPSCAMKIATALEVAFMAYQQALTKNSFNFGDGIIKEDLESTMAAISKVAAEGMRQTDLVIMREMLDK